MDSLTASTRSASACLHCGGRCEPQLITLTLRRSQTNFVFVRNVPADVCQICGEAQFSMLTTNRMMAALHTDRAPDEIAIIPIYDLANARP